MPVRSCGKFKNPANAIARTDEGRRSRRRLRSASASAFIHLFISSSPLLRPRTSSPLVAAFLLYIIILFFSPFLSCHYTHEAAFNVPRVLLCNPAYLFFLVPSIAFADDDVHRHFINGTRERHGNFNKNVACRRAFRLLNSIKHSECFSRAAEHFILLTYCPITKTISHTHGIDGDTGTRCEQRD